ncbi:c2H2-type domain-containing protein [Trichonephila inaurata madagascariensis]|uniref:C2H2-type domain-containing protein n=1 Tax=Trichonephila inaurata madagascariensis TaxID=2747483 RepID=A0A8X6YNC3_9ARAC|nr:c2H2-type domain-containing protein [Trichonephila inaurata madagascariensis]
MAEAGASGYSFVNSCPFCDQKVGDDVDFRRHLLDIHSIGVKQLSNKAGSSIELVPVTYNTIEGKFIIVKGKLRLLKGLLEENFNLYLEHFKRWIHCDITRLEFDNNVRTFFIHDEIMYHHDFIAVFLKEIQVLSKPFRKIFSSNSTSTPILPAYLNFPSKASISSAFPSTYSNPDVKPPLSAQLDLTTISSHLNLASKPSTNNSYAVSKPSTFNNSFAAPKVSTSNHSYVASKPSVSNHLCSASKPSSSTNSNTGSKSSTSTNSNTSSKSSISTNSNTGSKSCTSTNSNAGSKSSTSTNSNAGSKSSTSNHLYATASKPSTSNNSYSATKPSTSARISPASKLVPPSHLNLATKEKSADGNLKKNNQLTNEGINIPNATFMSSAAGRQASDDTPLKNSETLYALSIVSSWENECVDMQKKEFSRVCTVVVNPNDPPKYAGDVTLPEILDTLLANPQLIPRKNMYDKAIRTLMKAMEKGELEIPASNEEKNV